MDPIISNKFRKAFVYNNQTYIFPEELYRNWQEKQFSLTIYVYNSYLEIINKEIKIVDLKNVNMIVVKNEEAISFILKLNNPFINITQLEFYKQNCRHFQFFQRATRKLIESKIRIGFGGINQTGEMILFPKTNLNEKDIENFNGAIYFDFKNKIQFSLSIPFRLDLVSEFSSEIDFEYLKTVLDKIPDDVDVGYIVANMNCSKQFKLKKLF